MKIAVLSDIHGNVLALEAVLADMEARKPDLLLNGGDILYGPMAPKATYELLLEYDFITVRGNQDRQIYEATPADRDANPTLAFVLDDLGAAPLEWMRSLPFDATVGNGVYLCHGTPTDDAVYLLEEVATDSPHLRSGDAIRGLLAGRSQPVIACGHSHLPHAVTLESGELIVNPGSVGLPAYSDDTPVLYAMQTFSPHASYALIEKRGGNWVVEQIHVPYAHGQAAEQARKRGREDWAFALMSGRSG